MAKAEALELLEEEELEKEKGEEDEEDEEEGFVWQLVQTGLHFIWHVLRVP